MKVGTAHDVNKANKKKMSEAIKESAKRSPMTAAPSNRNLELLQPTNDYTD